MPKPYKQEKPQLDAEKAKPPWVPKTLAEKDMLVQFRGVPKKDRMRTAVAKVVLEGESVSQSARDMGVSRPRLSLNVKAERAKLEEREERVAAGAKARAAQDRTENGTVPDRPESNLSLEPAEGKDTAPTFTVERRVPETFEQFNDYYFGNERCPDCDVHHETPGFHRQMMRLLEDRGRRMKLINCAPYHAKSTTATFKSTLFELCRDPSSRTAIISAGGDLAEAMLYQIKEHLTDPDLYIGAQGNFIEDWGPFHNQGQWGKKEIYIYGRSGAQKDPSVSTYGFGTKIYGRRFDRMIFDDVADLENQNTPDSINRMYRKIWQEYVNRVGKTGQLIFVGTRVAAGDIYSLLDDVEGMNVLRFPCIIDEESGEMLWGEHFHLEAARQQRAAMSPDQWQLVYQNVDTPGFGASFPPDVLERSHDQERFQGHVDSNWAVVIGLDPAGAGRQSGYTALVCLGVELTTGRRYLIDIVHQKQMKAPQTMQQIYDWCERYPVRELRVEVNGLQSQIYQYSEELNAKLVQKGVRLVPHITHKGNKFDPQFGVEAMSTLYHNGMISTPWQDINSRAKFKELEQELMQFPMGSTNDLVMAMWFAELGIKDLLQRQAIPAFDNRRRLPSRIANRRRVINFGDHTARQPTQGDLVGGLHGAPPPVMPHKLVNVAPGVGLAG